MTEKHMKQGKRRKENEVKKEGLHRQLGKDWDCVGLLLRNCAEEYGIGLMRNKKIPHTGDTNSPDRCG